MLQAFQYWSETEYWNFFMTRSFEGVGDMGEMRKTYNALYLAPMETQTMQGTSDQNNNPALYSKPRAIAWRHMNLPSQTLII